MWNFVVSSHKILPSPPNSASLKARVCFIEMTILWMCFRESQNWICRGWQGSSTCLCITCIAQLGAKLCRLWALGLPGKAAPWPALSPFKSPWKKFTSSLGICDTTLMEEVSSRKHKNISLPSSLRSFPQISHSGIPLLSKLNPPPQNR